MRVARHDLRNFVGLVGGGISSVFLGDGAATKEIR